MPVRYRRRRSVFFLTDEVHARPGMVGIFFTGSAVIGIIVSQLGRSDKSTAKTDRFAARAGHAGLRCCLPGTAPLYFAVHRRLSR